MKKSFTLLELVFVIVVIGILSAIIIPSTRSNNLREAAIQIVSHIRYTQHLAMLNDKFGINDGVWYKKRWQVVFEYATTEPKYSIYSDGPNYTGNADVGETAIDPLDKNKLLSGGGTGFGSVAAKAKINKKLNLSQTYAVTNITLTNQDGSAGGCKNQTRISFDYLGRPIQGTINGYTAAYKNNKLINKTCVITITGIDGSVEIYIEPETGYAHII